MIHTVKFSGMTKIKRQDGKEGWVGIKDIDFYPYSNGNGMVIWIWPESGQRKKPICLDFVGPHGLEDLSRLVQFLQNTLREITPVRGLDHDQQIQVETWIGVLAEHYTDPRELAQACADDLDLRDAEGETCIADDIYDIAYAHILP